MRGDHPLRRRASAFFADIFSTENGRVSTSLALTDKLGQGCVGEGHATHSRSGG